MKKFLYRFCLLFLVLAAGYSLFGIAHFKWMYHKVENSSADFLTQDLNDDNKDATITMVEFINYGCGYCKSLHPTMKELLEIRSDIKYTVRPIAFGEGATQNLTHIAIAAGLQDKFWEFHDAFLEYPQDDIPNDFIQELSALYGVDHDRLMKDSKGEAVKEIADDNSAALSHAALGSVPSFMINKKLYFVDESGVPDLKKMLDVVANAEKP